VAPGCGTQGRSRAVDRRVVLTLVESLRLGGAERLVATTVRRLDRERFLPIVAYLHGPADLAEGIRDGGVAVHEIGFRGPRDLPRAVRRVRALVRRERVDIVHTHLYFANVVGRLAAAGLARVVGTLHNPDYTYEARSTPRFFVRKELDRATMALARPRLLAVSEEVRRDYEKHFGDRGVRVLHNYVDVAALRAELAGVDRDAERRAWGLARSDVVFLHVGRFHRQKAHDVLLRAFAEALRDAPPLRLLLAGSGALEPEMRALAGDLDLGDRVLFLGSVARMAPLYAAADAFVFPSRYEAFGIALLEAMVAGLPAAVTRAGGIPEVATQETALFVDPERVSPLALAIVRLARDAGLRARLGAGAARVAERFDAPAWVSRLEAIYEEA